MHDPYDELPYHSNPIEWTAPERLALASLLHGGPRPRVDRYRMLELGCGNGANLIALAYHRRHAEFVGVDGSQRHIAVANAHCRELGLDNLTFVHADLRDTEARLDGAFDYVVAHGVFSWVPDDARDAMLALHRRCLAKDGLYYLDYNARPGWDVRGLVRTFLLAQTKGETSFAAQARAAIAMAGKLAGALVGGDHGYSQLMAAEFRLVADAEISYVAHEYLAPVNRAYWRSDFLALVRGHGLDFVADADFDRPAGHDDPKLASWLVAEGIAGRGFEDTGDLLRFRQHHAPILAATPWVRHAMTLEEFGGLFVASSLVPAVADAGAPARFDHPSGQRVDVTDARVIEGLSALAGSWPRGVRVRDAFASFAEHVDDLQLLHRFGMLELRCVEPGEFGPAEGAGRLHELEARTRGEITTAYHRRVAAPTS